MTKAKQVTAKPVLEEKDFSFIMEMALGGGLSNPETTDEEKARFTELSGKKVTVADSLNISLTVAQHLLQQGMGEMFDMVTKTMDTANILVTAVKAKGLLDDEDFQKANDEYNKHLNNLMEQMNEAQEKGEELNLVPDNKGMTVVRNESDVDLTVKG